MKPAGVPAERYVTVTPPVMAKLAGLSTVPPGALAAEVRLPAPADLLAAPRGALTRVLVLDGVQVRPAAAPAGVQAAARPRLPLPLAAHSRVSVDTAAARCSQGPPAGLTPRLL